MRRTKVHSSSIYPFCPTPTHITNHSPQNVYAVRAIATGVASPFSGSMNTLISQNFHRHSKSVYFSVSASMFFNKLSNSRSISFNSIIAALMSDVSKISIETRLPNFLNFEGYFVSFCNVFFEIVYIYRSGKPFGVTVS